MRKFWYKFNKYMLVILFFSFVWTGCQEDLDIDLKSNIPPKLVIEGRITNEYKEHLIRLTASNSYYSDELVGAAEASNVSILENGSGRIIGLNPVDTGIGWYSTEKFSGRAGETYTFRAIFNSEEYMAKAFLDTISTMDSISYNYVYYNFAHMGFYMINISVMEPQPAGDYYMFNLYLNNTLYNYDLSMTPLQSDEIMNGMYLNNINVFNIWQEDIKKDTNTIKVELLTISREEYNFDLAFLSETQNNGSVFSGPPADIPSNLKNLTSENHGLGYFGASSVTSMEKILIKAHNDATNRPD